MSDDFWIDWRILMKVLYSHWKDFVFNNLLDDNINTLIANSWTTSKKNNVDFTGKEAMVCYNSNQLEQSLDKNRTVIDIIDSYIEVFYNNLGRDTSMAINYLDKDCYIIRQWDRKDYCGKLKDLGLFTSVCCHHEVMGTNGAGLAQALGKAVIIEGYEHYIEAYHNTTQMSAPIQDSNGNIVGILDITMPVEDYILSFYRVLMLIIHGIERELKLMNYIDEEKLELRKKESRSIANQRINDKYRDLLCGYVNRQEFLNEIYQQPYIGVVHYSHPERRIIDANGRYVEIVRDLLKTDDILGLTFEEYAKDWIDRNRAGVFWEERLRTGTGGTITEFCIPKNNKDYYYNISVKPLKINENIVGWLEAITDVTEIRLAKQQLEKREKFVIDVFDAFDVPVSVVSYPDFNIKFINRRAQNLIGNMMGYELDKNSIEGKSIDVMFKGTENCRYIDALKSIGDYKKEIYIDQAKIRLSNGHERIFKIALTPMFDSDSNMKSIVTVGMDITEEIEFTKAKDEFFSIISHELRSPTNIIISATQLLLMNQYKEGMPEQVIKHIQRIKQNSYRLLRLINNFLDIQRTEAGYLDINLSNVEFIGATEDMTSTVVQLAESKGVKVIFDTDIEEKIIAIDIEKYERVLLNLLANATKFTSDGGEILVTVSEVKDFVKVSVKDNGIGISKDKLDKIFDKFIMVDSSLSRRSEGTGLGLALVKLMVNKMGGKIEVNSEEGIGTEFIVYLPDQKLEDSRIDEPIKTIKEIEHTTTIEFSDIYFI